MLAKGVWMDRVHTLTVFIAIADEGSFAAAARRLSLSPAAVTRAVAELESNLGVKLLNRTTRFVRVSEAGQRYLEDARRILSMIEEADENAAGVHAMPRGQLLVTAPSVFGRMFVARGVVDYLQRYPDMEVSFFLLDRIVNLLEEGIDVAVRIGELPDSSMRAIRVGQVRRVVCAAPGYLEKHGTPQSPDELVHHTIVAAVNVSSTVEWRFNCGGEIRPTKVKPRLHVTSNEAAIEVASMGFGVTRLMSYQVAPLLSTGQLETILPQFELAALPIHVVYREGRLASAKVRSFVDLIVERLRAEPSLQK
jgi:DNA-binding transcriptional LysR family regulator